MSKRISADDTALDKLLELGIAEFRTKTNGETCREAYITSQSLQDYLQKSQNDLQELRDNLQGLQNCWEELTKKFQMQPGQILAKVDYYRACEKIIEELSQQFANVADLPQSLPNIVKQLQDDCKRQAKALANSAETTANAAKPAASLADFMQPFPQNLLQETAKRLSERYKRDVQPMQVLVDMFLRYTLERYNLWFYPFVLNDIEIVEIAQKVNPELRNINQVKKMLAL